MNRRQATRSLARADGDGSRAIAGFAFSALAGAALAHLSIVPTEAVETSS